MAPNSDNLPVKRGRPEVYVDPMVVEKMAAILMSQEEIAHMHGISRVALGVKLKNKPELREAFDRGRAIAKMRLREAQMKYALKGNTPLLIHLGKQHDVLGQHERPPINDTQTQNLNIKVQYVAAWGKSAGEISDEIYDETHPESDVIDVDPEDIEPESDF